MTPADRAAIIARVGLPHSRQRFTSVDGIIYRFLKSAHAYDPEGMYQRINPARLRRRLIADNEMNLDAWITWLSGDARTIQRIAAGARR